MQYEILDWDSLFFGIKVGRINQENIGSDELTDLISLMKKDNFDLVYFPSKKQFDLDFVSNLGGFLADKKLTFNANLLSLDLENFISTNIVESYSNDMSLTDIESLAIQSGKYSRFSVDPKLSDDSFRSLYKIWINRSLNKEIASEVLLIRGGEKIAGMVTLGDKNGFGDIGLIAIDSDYRGKGYGEILVRSAQKWFLLNGYEYSQVVTQGDNTPACGLYKKCGYEVSNLEYFYHFWL